MQVKIDIKFHHAEVTYFKVKRLHAYIKRIMCEGIQFDKSSSMK